MKVICVDDEPLVLEDITTLLKRQREISSVTAFLSPMEALDWAKENQPDAAFLDINMGQMDGLMMAKQIREQCPECAIVFVTGYPQYAVDAFSVHADGYLLKPATEEDVRGELEFILSKRVLPPPKVNKRIRIRCFGNFEVFCDDRPVRFERSKTKELMAYLVDRQGSAVSSGELIAVLWEDAPDGDSTRSNLRNLVHDLKRTLTGLGVEELLVKDRNKIAINCAAVSCDFYDFQNRMPYAVNLYRGEYMSQYSWAEITSGSLY